MIDYEQIGKRIKLCREQKNLTQEKLAERLNVSPHCVYEWERGAKTMSLYILIDLAECLEVSSDYLLYGKTNNDQDNFSEDALSLIIRDLSAQQRERLAGLIKEMMPYIVLEKEETTSNHNCIRANKEHIIISYDILERLEGPYELSVYVYLKRYANQEGICTVSIAELENDTHISEKKIRLTLKQLKRKGLLSIKNRTLKNGGKTSNSYQLLGESTII